MPEITFTQFILPHGRREQVTFPCSEEVRLLANEIEAENFTFECEQLRTGIWSFTISDTEVESDVLIEICEDTKEARIKTIEQLVKQFNISTVLQQRDEDLREDGE